ncbi:hypothetical protein [Variovorax paradoxus]|uniref:Uncharacterized protein n=1 Tax=Variovorax paradoxus (strain EPS) TaxID=595537 RepID=E6V3R6_VARPE|nr:hypothetical protein [Variovorax paradoxus]ADU36940.1 hypothetical protein Varpa_2742 [Variovorax paradoxus EPS]
MTAVNDDDAVIAELPDLRIEVSHSEDMVILQQRGGESGEDRIAIHRWQVRMLAEHFGLLPARTQARVTVETLARRLLKLHARIDLLGEHIDQFVDDEFTKQYSLAMCEIADEFIADIEVLTGGAIAAPKRAAAGVTP